MSHPVGGDAPSPGFTDGGADVTPSAPVPACESVPASAARVAYVAYPVRTILPPIPSTTGVAGSETGLWFIGGGHNANTHQLVHVDLTSGETTFSHEYTNLIETLGTGVFGIAYDGSSVWISVSGNTNKVVQVDATSGEIVRTIASPSVLGPSDLHFRGDELVMSTGTGEVFAISLGAIPEVTRLFQSREALSGRDAGVAVLGDTTFVSGLFEHLDAYGPTGSFEGEVVDGFGQPFGLGAALDFFGDQLVIARPVGVSFYELCANRTR